MLPSFLTDPVPARIIGGAMLASVAAYCLGSLFNLPSLTLSGVKIAYPRGNIVLRQMIAAPAEIIGASGIIYFTLPEAGNPGFLVVLAVFIFSFLGGAGLQCARRTRRVRSGLPEDHARRAA